MKPADILDSLFPAGHDVTSDGGLLLGSGALRSGSRALVIGIADRTPLGVDEAIRLSRHVLASLDDGSGPILVLVDSDSQRMSKRDELLGLNEFLAHLAKTLIHADLQGRPTIGLLYGHSAAGAFLATAMATRVLVALPGADPAVMDLPSMAKVTKLPLEVLQEKAKSTPVFAPGLRNLAQTGAVSAIWDETEAAGRSARRVARQPAGRPRCARCARQAARRPRAGGRRRRAGPRSRPPARGAEP